MNNSPDLEVIFYFNGSRKTPIYDGYRPAHRITRDYLTSGTHHYYTTSCIPSNGTAMGTITFISPEAYPACCWVGKRICIQEGSHVVGYAVITKILNSNLEKIAFD